MDLRIKGVFCRGKLSTAENTTVQIHTQVQRALYALPEDNHADWTDSIRQVVNRQPSENAILTC
ncbi:hypothetical protein OE749_05660 [Aestuariibacter sp. AA17]|uniref:Uncharacterized protein n=1 Tax=Fluctibacter corallii TaxID=2984329 RepID=A0ABT3A6E7_9ALTE|nr:hypothetical protein [Aestuariibacter sp. AA17]MCV2884173.1 hypothetical protein [Aestuariibacter sp. AA17]